MTKTYNKNLSARMTMEMGITTVGTREVHGNGNGGNSVVAMVIPQ